jgi:anti-anti-sigma factor
MNIEQRQVGDITLIDVRGRLTMNDGHGQLKQTITGLTERGCVRIVLNLQDLRYLDSACLGELINSHIRLSRQQGRLKLLNVPNHLHELLKLAGLEGVFETFTSEADAVRSFQPPAS